jgi:hypothetical protein
VARAVLDGEEGHDERIAYIWIKTSRRRLVVACGSSSEVFPPVLGFADAGFCLLTM